MQFLPGDIAACHGADWMSRCIRWGTASLIRSPRIGPSHVAMIAALPIADLHREPQELYWWESTTLCHRPCLLAEQCVSGVQVHSPADRISDYVAAGGRVDIYRLAHFHRLDRREELLLATLLTSLMGSRYDMTGALLSGTRVFQLTRLFPGADLHSLFCSEMLAAVLMRLNRMNHDNPTRFNPARLLRVLVRTGLYARVETFEALRRPEMAPAGASTLPMSFPRLFGEEALSCG